VDLFFFQLGVVETINGEYVVELVMADYAKQEGALMVALEHRFYGESRPLALLSLENLAFLTSEQALADAALFISSFKALYPTSKDVIVFGGSYAGNLAAWFKLKYPNLAMAAVASSAPVLAELDMTQYLDVVGQSLTKISGIECDENIKKATQEIQTLLSLESGRMTLAKLFQTCDPIDTDEDIATFMSNLMAVWMEAAQYNTDLPPRTAIAGLCSIMDNSTASLILQYASVVSTVIGNTCLDVSYQKMIGSLKNETNFGPTVGDRQWAYQSCVEFGYFQTTESQQQPFGDLVPLEYFTNICRDVFRFTWLPNVKETNLNYGGKNPSGTNVLFVNGALDPWSSLSITTSISDSLIALVVPDTSHCADMLRARPSDPADLAVAQQKIASQIHKWLG